MRGVRAGVVAQIFGGDVVATFARADVTPATTKFDLKPLYSARSCLKNSWMRNLLILCSKLEGNKLALHQSSFMLTALFWKDARERLPFLAGRWKI